MGRRLTVRRIFHRKAGQSLIEFAVVAPLLFTLMIGGATIIVALLQSWALGRATNWLGEQIAQTGLYTGATETNFINKAQLFGVDLVTARDTLSIKVTAAVGNGPCGSPTCTYSWGTTPTVRYADFVNIGVSKPLSIPGVDSAWLNTILGGSVPGARAAWAGVAQRDSANGGVFVAPGPNTGLITGTIRDATTSAAIVGATVTLSPGGSTTTDSLGTYQFSALAAGAYTVSAIATKYQGSSAGVTLATSSTTVNQDLYLSPGATVTVQVVPAGGVGNYLANGDFETATGWVSTVTADAPAGWWRLGEINGTVAVDASAGANNGAYVGPPTTLAYDHFPTTIANGWGTAAVGGAYTITGTAANFSTGTYLGAAYGAMTQTTTGTAMSSELLGVTVQDTDTRVSVQTDKLAVGASLTAGVVTRVVNATNDYRVTADFAPSGAISLSIYKDIAGVPTLLVGPTATGLTHLINHAYWIRVQTYGVSPTTIRARIWDTDTPEPSAWLVSTTDAAAGLQGSYALGVQSLVSLGNTNTPHVIRFGGFYASALTTGGCTCTLAQPGALGGDINTAVAFDGSSGYVAVPSSAGLNLGTLSGATGMSLEAWVKRTGTGAMTIMSKGNQGYWLRLESIAADGGKIWFSVMGANALAKSVTPITVDGIWHHVVATADLATSGGHSLVSNAKLYLDGLDVTSSVAGASLYNTNDELQIGRNGFAGDELFRGLIDEPLIYRAKLAPATVLSHYRAGYYAGSTASWANGSAPFALAATSFLPTNTPTHGGRSAAVVVTDTTANEGIVQAVAATFTIGVVYKVSVWVEGAAGSNIGVLFGDSLSADYASAAVVGTGAWQQVTFNWTPSSTHASGVQLGIRANSGETVARTLYVDDARVWKAVDEILGATVTTSYGLRATEIGNGLYRFTLAAGTHTIQVNTVDNRFGTGSITVVGGDVKTLSIGVS